MKEYLNVILTSILSLVVNATVLWMLWPIVMVVAFNLPAITFGQAAALVVIANILTSTQRTKGE